ncbi:MAG: ABC transporter ATP-binding protein [Candidatus Rokubacteria bacterium]|nr:ABC transporter ATP-binding protein [Candidatus Rokubacteria bacterium]
MFDRIRIEHLGLTYDTAGGRFDAVGDVSFAIERREICCLVGPSGCGKSSLLNALGGLLAPTGGRIVVESSEPRDLAALRKGMVFQEYALFPWRTALGNVEFGLEVLGQAPAERRRNARQALEQVGLSAFADFHPHRLSGGMRQRVAVARALAFDPDVLLMDEPFAALDEQMREDLQALVVQLWEQTGRTIVYVTHSINEAVFLADRVIVLSPRPGTVRAQLAIDLKRPRNRLSNEFLDHQRELTELVRGAGATPRR